MPNRKLLSLLKVDRRLGEVPTLLVDCIYEAHRRTCLLTIEQIKEQWEVGVEQYKLEYFMRMVGFHLNTCAQK